MNDFLAENASMSNLQYPFLPERILLKNWTVTP